MNMFKTLCVVSVITLCSQQVFAASWGDNRTNNYSNGQFLSYSEDVPLNEYFQASIHNAYEKSHTLYDILRYYGTNIELDFFDEGRSGDYRSGDWYVRHDDPDEDVKCINDGDHDYLTECLQTIQDFHYAYPNHDLITIWLDKKQNWQPSWECSSNYHNPCRRPGELDSLFSQYFSGFMYTPLDLRNRHSTGDLRNAAVKGWPKMSELRGKIMVVMTDSGGGNARLEEYLDVRGNSALAFVAPKLFNNSVDAPDYMSGVKQHVVFYNLASDKRHFGPEIFRQSRISRTWGTDLNDYYSYDYRSFLIQNGAGDSYTSSNRYTGALLKNTVPLFTQLKSKQVSNGCVGVDGGSSNGNNVQLETCGSTDTSQVWAVIPYASPSYQYFLTSIVAGKRADIKSHNFDNGTNIHVWDHREGSHQRWNIWLDSSGNYEIVNAYSDRCFDVSNSAIGSTVHQWSCHGQSNQRYRLATYGQWHSSSGQSWNHSSNPRYTLKVNQSGNVSIDLESNIDTYLYLYHTNGSYITHNDDGGVGYNSKITYYLSAGEYIVTAATYSSGQTGNFILTTTQGSELVERD